jgi:hypothetical protein
MKHAKYIELAREQAKRSNMQSLHGCVVVCAKSGQVLRQHFKRGATTEEPIV